MPLSDSVGSPRVGVVTEPGKLWVVNSLLESHDSASKSPSYTWVSEFIHFFFKNFLLNPHLPNELSHPYQLDESSFHLRGVWCTVFIFIIFLLEIPVSKQCWPWSRSVASDLGLHCLPMFQKWDFRLIWVKFKPKITALSNYWGLRIFQCPIPKVFPYARWKHRQVYNFTTWATSRENLSSEVCDEVRHKPACSATETSWSL